MVNHHSRPEARLFIFTETEKDHEEMHKADHAAAFQATIIHPPYEPQARKNNQN
jgi:hypothetical protein